MKPIRLEFNAFGPFAQKEVVDFESMAESGIFLICGPTGAGKTTIFDGICFALYGEASGALRQNEDFKSDFSDPSDLCFVRYSFWVREKKFEVYRSPKQKKQKKNGDITTVSAKAELVLPDGTVLTGPAAVSARIQEILGLTAKQFKQITMLAQGDFRRFLDAPSKEKQEIFRHIFDTEKFDQFTVLLEQESKKALENMEKEQQELSFHLKSLTKQNDVALASFLEAEYPLVPSILERLTVLLKNDQKLLEEHQNSIQQLENRIAALHIETHRQNNQRLLDLEKLQKEKEQLSAKNPEMEQLRALLDRLKSAKDLIPLWQKRTEQLEEQKSIQMILEKKNAELSKLFPKSEETERQWMLAKQKSGQKDSLLSAIASLQSFSSLLDEKDLLSRSIKKLKKEIVQNENEFAYAEKVAICQTQEKEISKIRDRSEICRVLLQTIAQKKQLLPLYQQQKTVYLQNYTLFLDAQAGILASKLQENTPCPVCGSCDHPSPAPLKNNPPTQEQLRAYHDAAEHTSQQLFQLNEKIVSQYREIKNAFSPAPFLNENDSQPQEQRMTEILNQTLLEQKTAEEKLQRLQRELCAPKGLLANPLLLSDEDAIQAYREDRRKKLESCHSKLILQQEQLLSLEKKLPSGITSQEELEQKIQNFRSSVKQLDVLLEKTQKEYQETISQIRSVKQSLTENQERMRLLQEKISTTQKTFSDSLYNSFPGGQKVFLDFCAQIGQISAIEKQIHQYQLDMTSLEGRICQLQEQLNGVRFIDITDLLKQEASLQKQIEILRKEASVVQSRLSQDMAHKKQIESIYQKIEKSEWYYRQVNDLFRIASGNNDQRISFERYVLGFYFDAIVSFANHRLENLTGGRYLLCRKKDREKFGRSSGLDLEILDQYSGKIRPTSTLSGGESFKTALALALSLADVVQMYAGGVVIDTMFIDEGFGSLDAESLDSAVEALLSLGNDGRLVGIISHLPQLKEQIPSQIQVKTGRNGSTIQILP